MVVTSEASGTAPVSGRVTVIGCGLIGGSIVKALRDRTSAWIAAVDSEPVLRLADPWLDGGAVPGSDLAREIVGAADITVLALPVGAIVASLPWVLESLGTHGLATDTGSVKRPIVGAARSHEKGERFVGGHPMTGRELGGFEASTPTLFDGARWFLVRDARGGPAAQPVADLVRSVGAIPVSVEADAHDRAMAYASHAPQLIASALVAAAGRAGVLGDAGPGFRDLTRIAGGPTGVWRDIFAANRSDVAAALADILRPLVAAQGDLASGGEPGLDFAMSLLDEARQAIDRASLPSGLTGKEHE
jgi:prephenate dehydrogenase